MIYVWEIVHLNVIRVLDEISVSASTFLNKRTSDGLVKVILNKKYKKKKKSIYILF